MIMTRREAHLGESRTGRSCSINSDIHSADEIRRSKVMIHSLDAATFDESGKITTVKADWGPQDSSAG